MTRDARIFTLTGDTLPDITDPSWSTVEVALWALSDSGNTFIVLSTADHEFLQTSGVPASLVIEVKRKEDNGEYRQYRLCRKGAWKKDRTAAQAYVLDITDALQCFEAYYECREVPRHYALNPLEDFIAETLVECSRT